MKKQLAMMSAFGVLTAPWMNTAFAAASAPHFVMNNSYITMDGKSVSKESSFVYQKTTYMPIWYVMNVLSSLHIQSNWGNHEWRLQLPTNITPDLSNIQPGKGNTSIYVNNVLVTRVNTVATVDPASHKQTTYMPIWYVMQLLQRLGVISGWDGTQWDLFSGIPHNAWVSFTQKHPGAHIADAKVIPSSTGASTLVIATAPAHLGDPADLTFITPNNTVTDFSLTEDHPGNILYTDSQDGVFVGAYGFSGAHFTNLSIFHLTDNGPSLVQTFGGDNGASFWLQDNAVNVLVSNRTYNWNLVSPTTGQPDDSAVTQIFQFNNASTAFKQRASFVQGVFSTQPDLPSEPTADTLSTVYDIDEILTDPTTAGDVERDWPSSLANAFHAAQPTLAGFMNQDPMNEVVSLTTLYSSSTQANYLYQAGSHSVLFTAEATPNWQVTDLTVDPSQDLLNSVKGGLQANSTGSQSTSSTTTTQSGSGS